MVDGLMRGLMTAGLLSLSAAGAQAAAAGDLNTDAFLAACTADQVVTDDPGFAAGAKATPQLYCECIAGKFKDNKISQADVDMMTKMHKDEITDEDAAKHPKLEELMEKNEGFEDECRSSLGMPSSDDDEEGPPPDEEDIPQDE